MTTTNPDALKDQLREIICEVAEIDEVPDDTPFADLGIDSMMAIEIVADVERTWKLTIPEEELTELTSFRRVYERVTRELASAA